MTIDERLEALRQSGELLLKAQRETGETIRRVAIIATQNDLRAGQMMDAIRGLARLMESRKQRSHGPQG